MNVHSIIDKYNVDEDNTFSKEDILNIANEIKNMVRKTSFNKNLIIAVFALLAVVSAVDRGISRTSDVEVAAGGSNLPPIRHMQETTSFSDWIQCEAVATIPRRYIDEGVVAPNELAYMCKSTNGCENTDSSTPSFIPSSIPSSQPSTSPSSVPSKLPSATPTTSFPSTHPSSVPSIQPSLVPSDPAFPDDFRWSSAGIPSGYDCTQIYESDPHTWDDNYFCWKKGKKDPGMEWSSAGPISSMRCTQINERSDPHAWHDNYLCVEHSSPLHFAWSSAGPISNESCIQWHESADPHTWDDNYLCSAS